METFSALLALCAGNSLVRVNSPHKVQWRGALMFSLIYTPINDWVNNREAGDLRRHSGHYDVNVMIIMKNKDFRNKLNCGLEGHKKGHKNTFFKWHVFIYILPFHRHYICTITWIWFITNNEKDYIFISLGVPINPNIWAEAVIDQQSTIVSNIQQPDTFRALYMFYFVIVVLYEICAWWV